MECETFSDKINPEYFNASTQQDTHSVVDLRALKTNGNNNPVV